MVRTPVPWLFSACQHEAMVAQRILKTDRCLRVPRAGTGGYGRGREGARNGTTGPASWALLCCNRLGLVSLLLKGRRPGNFQLTEVIPTSPAAATGAPPNRIAVRQ